MSLTRHVWKPWRAKTRTAASRIRRRFSAAAALERAVAISGRAPGFRIDRPLAVDLRSAVGERRQVGADARQTLEVEVGDDVRLGVGGLREHDPPGVEADRPPAVAQPGRVAADLVGGDDEGLV